MIQLDRVAIDDGERIAELRRFVEGHPAATAHSMPTWLASMGTYLHRTASYRTARASGRLVGLVAVVERPLHDRLTYLPSWAQPKRAESLGHDCYAGPLLAHDLAPTKAAEVLRSLVDEMSGGRTMLTSIFAPAWCGLEQLRATLVGEMGFREVRSYPIAVKRLTGLDDRSLPGTYCKAHRNAADAARRRGVIVATSQSTSDLLEFSDLLDETLSHANASAAYSKDFIVEAGLRLIEDGLAELLLARVDDRIIGGMFVLLGRHSTCYWLGATAKDERTLKHRPMNALLPTAFSRATNRGSTWFELGGLMTPGLRAFKLGWGAEELSQPTFERSFGNLMEPLREARARLHRVGG